MSETACQRMREAQALEMADARITGYALGALLANGTGRAFDRAVRTGYLLSVTPLPGQRDRIARDTTAGRWLPVATPPTSRSGATS